MFSRMIAATAGIASVAWFTVLPAPGSAVLALPLAALFIVCERAWIKTSIAFLAGILWAVVFAHQLLSAQLPVALEGQDVWVRGVVVGLPQQIESLSAAPDKPAQRFNLRVTSGLCRDVLLSTQHCQPGIGTLRLSWYQQNGVKPGQQWRLQVRLKRPRGLANPGGFDYHTWLVHRRISAVGYVREHKHNRQLNDSKWSVDRWRHDRWQGLNQSLHNKRHTAIFYALLFGDKRGLSPEQWELFARTGTTHLMVISGLHIGLIGVLVFSIVRTVLPLLSPRSGSERPAAIAAIIAAALYSGAAGFSLPTQRALVMLSIWMLAVIARRELAPWQGMVCALFVCLLLDPLAPVSSSFWLSFTAVAVIFYGTVGRRRVSQAQITHSEFSDRLQAQDSRTGLRRVLTNPARWSGLLPESLWRAQYLVFIGLLPVLPVITGQFSLLTPIANVIAVPVFSFCVVPLTLLAAIISALHGATATLLWSFLDNVLDVLWVFLNLVNSHGHVATGNTITPENPQKIWLYLLAITGMLIISLPQGMPLRFAAVILIMPMIMYKPQPPANGALAVHVLDVGQGLAVVVQTHRHSLVYDVGAAQGGFVIARHVLIPFLQNQAITELDQLVISHGDNDHAGGWRDLSEVVPVRHLHYGQWLAEFAGLPATACQAGHQWQWDGVTFAYLHPPAMEGGTSPDNFSTNNQSCVLKISTSEVSFLLTGDIERAVELQLVEQYYKHLDATVLIAPHHGSATSSSWPFLRAVKPLHVVVSSGYRNRFGHPDAQVLKRYRALAATVHETSIHGAISFRVNNEQLLTIYHYRDAYWQYWF